MLTMSARGDVLAMTAWLAGGSAEGCEMNRWIRGCESGWRKASKRSAGGVEADFGAGVEVFFAVPEFDALDGTAFAREFE